jgi:hypothetical protein
MAVISGSASTVNMSNASAEQCVQVSAVGWQDSRIELLDALGNLGQLLDALGALFGPGVAAPLRAALSDVRSHELYLVDGVIDNEARLRQQVADLQQHLNRAIAVRDEVLEREKVKDDRLVEAACEELSRARRQNRRLSLWAMRTIADAVGPLNAGWWPAWIPERDRQWLRDCRAAIESGWADACRG